MTRPALRVIEGGQIGSGREDRRELLQELYRCYAASVFSRCRYLLKSETEAEDAMQEVFAKAMKNLERFRGEASPLTWLTKIATHHCLNQIRARKNRDRRTSLQQASLHEVTHDAPGLLEARDQVHRHLGRFDLETQRAVVHYHVDGMTLEEVADLLGRSIPTVRKRIARFTRALEQEA